MGNCVFCKIISGDIPSYKVYEDENALAFLDIAPVNYGHTLVVTKKHFANMEEIPEEELCRLMKAVKKVGKAIKEGMSVEGYNVNENNDPVAGQIIRHIHFHIVPRHVGDRLEFWAQGEYNKGEADKIAEKIRKVLL